MIKQIISCKSVDELEPCPNERVVHIPGECCPRCGMFLKLCLIIVDVYTLVTTLVFMFAMILLCSLDTPDPPTDKFDEWGDWTPCSKTCGRGAQARRRNCLIAENGTIVNCVGEKLQIRDCNAQECLSMLHNCRAQACAILCVKH